MIDLVNLLKSGINIVKPNLFVKRNKEDFEKLRSAEG
jgi:hypothetical protein